MKLGRPKSDEQPEASGGVETSSTEEENASTDEASADAKTYTVQERLALTEDGERLVPEDSKEARWLYTIPGRTMSMADAIRFGLVDGKRDK